MILQDKPIQEEYETVTKILKTQRELLQVGDQEQLIPFTCIMNAKTAIIQTTLCGTLFSAARLSSRKRHLKTNYYGPFTFPMEVFFAFYRELSTDNKLHKVTNYILS